jgi:hypothetical protein
MATPFVAGILATFVTVEGPKYGEYLYQYSTWNSVYKAVTNLPWGEVTTTRFATTGINNPYKSPDQPFRRPQLAEADMQGNSNTCTMNATEVWRCENEFFFSLGIKDSKGNTLYATQTSHTLPNGQPLPFDEKERVIIESEGLSSPLGVVAGEDKHIRFQWQELEWNTGTTQGPATCELLGGDWNKDGPGGCDQMAQVSPTLHSRCKTILFIVLGANKLKQSRTFKCQYPCR